MHRLQANGRILQNKLNEGQDQNDEGAQSLPSPLFRADSVVQYVPGVCPWKLLGGAPLLNGEQLRSVAAVQLREAVDRDARCARHELQ